MKSITERFEEKYAIDNSSGCWIWVASIKPRGYGEFWDGAKKKYAHRVSYELHYGHIPEGLVIDHLCGTPLCVNPTHLEAVTQGENVRRGKATFVICEHGTGRSRCDLGCGKKYMAEWQLAHKGSSSEVTKELP